MVVAVGMVMVLELMWIWLLCCDGHRWNLIDCIALDELYACLIWIIRTDEYIYVYCLMVAYVEFESFAW